MITQLLVGIILGTISGMLSLAPSWQVDLSPLANAVHDFGHKAATFNGYFPLITLGLCLAIVFGLKAGMFGWRLILFIYHQFWGSS